MDEDNAWYNQPMDDDWSDVSNLQGYDQSGNWTGTQTGSDTSIFDNMPVMDNWDTWNNPETGLSFQNSQFGEMPGYDAQGNWTGQNINFNIQDQMPTPANVPGEAGLGGGIQSALSKLFSNPTMGAKVLGALVEGNQNKRRAAGLNSIANKPAFDPFGSQRPTYQAELQRTIENPYSSPIVRQQVDQIARAQAIKDAAAGRRSNSATSSPAMLAAQAKVAQDYMNSLYTPAGANIRPDSGSMAQLFSQANAAGTNGYASPLLSVLGNATKTADNQAMLEQLAKLFKGG